MYESPLASLSSFVKSEENWRVPSLLMSANGCISLLYLVVGSCVPLALARA